LKSRTVLNIALFIAIIAAVLSFIGFLLAFVVKGEQVFVPVGKNYYKTLEGTTSEEKKENFYFGKNPNNMSAANIFDSSSRFISLTDQQTTETVEESKVVPEVSKEDIFFYLENPDKCTLLSGYELTGTIVAKDNDFSFAILKGNKGSSGGAVTRTGAEVQEGVILAFVWRNIAIFRTTNGIRCIGEGVGEAKQMPVPEAPKVAGEAPQQPQGDDEFDIRSVGPNQYVLKRSDLNKVTGNLGALASQARIVPSKKDNGFKIFSIAKDSLFGKIGIQNGDVLKSINGIELSSPDKALEAYSRLQSASKLSLDIIRKGQNETLEYTIE
jgi:general secretion pathway protein C